MEANAPGDDAVNAALPGPSGVKVSLKLPLKISSTPINLIAGTFDKIKASAQPVVIAKTRFKKPSQCQKSIRTVLSIRD